MMFVFYEHKSVCASHQRLASRIYIENHQFALAFHMRVHILEIEEALREI